MLSIHQTNRLLLLLAFSVTLLLMVGCAKDLVSPTFYSLTIQVIGEGEVNLVGSHQYEKDALVELKATPAEGWKLKEWVGDVADTELAETTSHMNKSKVIKAIFVPKEITYLKDLGIEGRLEENAAYSIHDHTVLGYWSASFLQSKVPPQESNVALMIGREVFLFTSNPLHQDIYEVHIPDDYSIEEIRNGILYSTKSLTSTTNLELQGETALKHVVIEKENTLYAIDLSLFMSMRNANQFVFDDQGSFIVPSYVGSNVDDYYLLEDYMSARNAANGSIAGAFALLAQNPEFTQDIHPTIVRVVDGEIIFESPHWILRDLGNEGSLDEPDNVYNIIDNTSFGYWSVSLLQSRLPREFANADTFALTIRETSFSFNKSQFNPDMFEVNIPDSYSKEEIRDGIFEDKSDGSVVEYTLTIAVEGSGAVSPAVGSHTYREDVTVNLTATPSPGWEFQEWIGEVQNTTNDRTTVLMNKNKTVTAVFSLEEDIDDSIVQFEDRNLEQVVREAINKPTGDLYLADVNQLEELDASGRGIVSLAGIQHLQSLYYLDLGPDEDSDAHNSIEDISLLSQLTQLEMLILWSNRVRDISPLSNLTNLFWLDLDDNQIIDISPLSNLTNLEWLFFGENQVADIQALQNLTNLEWLDFYSNQVEDISALVNNTGLGSDAMIDMTYNYLDLTPGSKAMRDIETLTNRGVFVFYDPQRDPVDPSSYTLTITKEGQGTVNPAEGNYTHDKGARVPLEASPAEGWEFYQWVGEVEDNFNKNTTVLMDKDQTVKAVFTEKGEPLVEYTLTMSVEGQGTVEPREGAHRYREGTTVELRATPAAGWVFLEWQGDLSGATNPTSLVMNSDKRITAHFTPSPNDEQLRIHYLDLSSGSGSLVLENYGPQDRASVILFPMDDSGMRHVVQRLQTEHQGTRAKDFLLQEQIPSIKAKRAHLPDMGFLREKEEEALRDHQWASQAPPILEIERDLQLGQEEQFKVYLEGNRQDTITATLMDQGQGYALWVDKRHPMTTERAQEIGSIYQETIQPTVTHHFGREPTKETFPILNNAGEKVHLLFAPLRDAGGYFYGADLYSSYYYPDSNERKIIYVRYNTNERLDFEYMMGTVAHELQHMIFYNEKVLANRSHTIDDTWINEGFSQLAEDLTGFGYEQSGDLDTVYSFAQAPHEASLINWEGGYPDYGTTYLFTRYIYDRFGQGIISAISRSLQNPKVAHNTITGMEFHEVFRDWVITLLMHQREGVDPIYKFDTIDVDIATTHLSPGSSWTNRQIKGWGVFYTVVGPGNGSDLQIVVEGASPAGKFKMIVVEERGK